MKFVRDETGATAVMVAVMMPAVLFAAGAAVDVSYAVMLRSELSQITKVACSRLSTSTSRAADPAQQMALTGAAIDLHMESTRLDPDMTSFQFVPASEGTAQVQSRSIYTTNFMQIFGIEQMGLQSSELCTYNLRVPTGHAETACDLRTPYRNVGNSLSIHLAQVREQWRQHNESCEDVLQQDGWITNPDGTQSTTYRTVEVCTLPPAPNEILAGIVDQRTGEVYGRALLTDRSSRGKTNRNFSELPGGGTLVLQAVDGYPTILPEACTPGSSRVAPPAPPSSGGSSSGASPRQPAPAPPCEGGGGAAQASASAQASGSGSVSSSSVAVAGGGGCSSSGGGSYASSSATSDSGPTSSSALVGDGSNQHSAFSSGPNGSGATAFLNGSSGGAFTHGPQDIDFTAVNTWLP